MYTTLLFTPPRRLPRRWREDSVDVALEDLRFQLRTFTSSSIFLRAVSTKEIDKQKLTDDYVRYSYTVSKVLRVIMAHKNWV